jgi:hypothetical protein
MFRPYRRDPSGFTEIVPWTYSPLVYQGDVVNRLGFGVTREGDQIHLSSNGGSLGTWRDSGITGLSGVGRHYSPSKGRPKSDARFDNYRVVMRPTGGVSTKSSSRTEDMRCEPRSLESQIELVPPDLSW